jgi:mono/diheme cytochrome c family protein
MSAKISVPARKSGIDGSRWLRTILVAALCAAPVTALHAADTINGGKVYGQYCASCHGPSGAGMMPGTPNFTHGTSLMQPDNTLLNGIKAGKNAMPGFQGILSDQDIRDVIAYLRTLMR